MPTLHGGLEAEETGLLMNERGALNPGPRVVHQKLPPLQDYQQRPWMQWDRWSVFARIVFGVMALSLGYIVVWFFSSIKFHKSVGLHIEFPGMFPSYPDSGFRDDWSYDTSEGSSIGPVHWGSKYPACAVAGRQSPINLAPALTDHLLKPLKITMSKPCSNLTFHNAGSRLVVNVSAACPKHFKWEFKGLEYHLTHIELRSPSEHEAGLGLADAEVQLYHSTDAGQVSAIAVLGKSTLLPEAQNLWLEELVKAGEPWEPKRKVAKNVTFSLDPYRSMMPASPEYFQYTGSYTFPPCAAPVEWVVMQEPVRMSVDQLHDLKSKLYWAGVWLGDNNRPVQPRGERIVRYFGGSA